MTILLDFNDPSIVEAFTTDHNRRLAGEIDVLAERRADRTAEAADSRLESEKGE